jgi:hypothetical protein
MLLSIHVISPLPNLLSSTPLSALCQHLLTYTASYYCAGCPQPFHLCGISLTGLVRYQFRYGERPLPLREFATIKCFMRSTSHPVSSTISWLGLSPTAPYPLCTCTAGYGVCSLDFHRSPAKLYSTVNVLYIKYHTSNPLSRVLVKIFFLLNT